MGLNLGLGLEALKGYQAREQQIKTEGYQDRQRAYGVAQMDANQPGLQDAAAATTAGNQLRAAQANAEIGVLPKRTELAGLQLGNQVAGEQLKSELMPAAQQVERNKSSMALDESNQNLETFPTKLNEEYTKGITSLQEAQSKAFGMLPTALSQGKGPGIRYANAARRSGLFGDLVKTGPDIVDIQHGQGEDGKGAIFFINADGGRFGVSEDQMAKFSQLGQKYKFEKLKPGEVGLGVSETGQVKSLYTAPESAAEKLSKQPAMVATAEWMVKNGVAKSPSEAFDRLTTSRAKGKAGFIADMLKSTLMPGTKEEDIRKQEEAFGAMFERLNGGVRTTGSNTGAVPTMSPNVNSMFTD